MHTVFTKKAPEPAGHYAQAIVYNNVIYVSGQLPIDGEGNKLTNASVEKQTEQAIDNIEAILFAAGSDLNHVLQMTIYISDLNDWKKVNAVYSKKLGQHTPARAIVPVTGLHFGLKIEIQAVAVIS